MALRPRPGPHSGLGPPRSLPRSTSYFCSKTLFFTDCGTSGTNQAATSLMHRATCCRWEWGGAEWSGQEAGGGQGGGPPVLPTSKRMRKASRMARRVQNCSEKL